MSLLLHIIGELYELDLQEIIRLHNEIHDLISKRTKNQNNIKSKVVL